MNYRSTLFTLILIIALLPIHLRDEVAPLLAAPKQISAQSTVAEIHATPDLTIESITLTPPNPSAGSTVDIKVIVKNQGDDISPGFSIHLYVDPSGAPDASTPPTSETVFGLGLFAGDTFEWIRTGQQISSDDPKIYAWVDRDNTVVESDEDNNLFPQPAENNGPEPDGFEEDDTCVSAKEILVDGSIQDHNLDQVSGRDADWVKFVAKGGVKYHAQAITVGADADLEINLQSTCEGQPSFGNGVEIKFTAPADGIYYLRVQHKQTSYGPDTQYQLQVVEEAECQETLESGNVCSLATGLALNEEKTLSFCQPNDVDWTQVEVSAGVEYTFKARNVGGNANVQMSIFPECTDQISTSEGDTFVFTARKAGSIYIKTQNQNTNASGSGTEYTLKVEGDARGQCAEDVHEQNDKLADAKAIAIDGPPQIHNNCPAADEDWATFNGVAGMTYLIETVNLAGGADTILCLYDANGTQLQCNDDDGSGDGSRIRINASADTAYFLQTKAYDPEAVGPATQYELQVTTGGCLADSFEEDDELAQAKVIPTDGTNQQHNICPAEDHDWVKFEATGGTNYLLQTESVGPEADTVIELYDVNGQLLAQNDDHTSAISSQLSYAIEDAGTYYAKLRLFNPTHYGNGTEYNLSIRSGPPSEPTPTPTPDPGIAPTPAPTPGPTQIRTLILVNRSRLVDLHGESETTTLMAKLNELAQHDEVRGEIVRLDNHSGISAAYAAWIAALSDVGKANQLTDAIRALVMTYLQERIGIDYVILVGDDRAIPFRRIRDNTPKQTEISYKGEVDQSHPTGAAIAQDYFLTDDFYVDQEPTTKQGRPVFVPDIAIGRLVENPNDMVNLIDIFLESPVTVADQVLVTGYDFVQDAASSDCEAWRSQLGDDNVNCELIGDSWSGDAFRALQFQTESPFKIQSINGHATHDTQGAPDQDTNANDVSQASMDLSGGLLYTLACHGGLNVPESDSKKPVDLVEVFVRKGANYIGNTGYGWGSSRSIALSEKLVQLYTTELLNGSNASIGQALANAKQQYIQTDSSFNSYDEKVLQQWVLYGLPMFHIQTNASLSDNDPFPGVGFDTNLPTGSLGDNDLYQGSVSLNFAPALSDDDAVSLSSTDNGSYYDLYNSTHTSVGAPVQPLHFGDVTSQGTARAAVLRGGTYRIEENFDPVILTPYNEYVEAVGELSLEDTQGWLPAIPVDVQSHNEQSTLVTQLGQFNPGTDQLRTLESAEIDLYYSTSDDQSAPLITIVDALYDATTGTVHIKVGATDPSGIKDVIVLYIDDVNQSSSEFKSIALIPNDDAQKWLGSYAGNTQSRYLVQVVDNAGNLLSATNKGNYYRPAAVTDPSNVPSSTAGGGDPDTTTQGNQLYLPAIQR